ncbi:hypothetical protein KUCAC02_012352 [Chaenocephalus aceratus]|uniref:Uncharacterized protein n=1 Tax=Chaenocephalus aceratus TaxID=36190 RepID=A0ACB9XBF9_CHAAC|nr:hypothetical protein KUCAC02_012352 [Chaenocephalus aceratus]
MDAWAFTSPLDQPPPGYTQPFDCRDLSNENTTRALPAERGRSQTATEVFQRVELKREEVSSQAARTETPSLLKTLSVNVT